MPSTVFDTNLNVTSRLGQIKTLGYTTIIRYISANTSSEKCIKPAEARAIAMAGLKLGLVFEVWGGVGGFSHHDINALSGAHDGGFAKSWAAGVGAPDGSAVYFAIDTDATNQQIMTLVIPYFKAIKNTMGGKYRIGVYGCGAVCAAVLDAGYADLAWLSNAMGWNGSHAFKDSGRGVLIQRLPARIVGLDTDPDDRVHEGQDFGEFVPFSTAPIVIPPPATPVVAAASPTRMTNIIAACFAGPGDTEFSAYTGNRIDPNLPGASLPATLPPAKRNIMVGLGDKTVACPLLDKGPHYTRDPYWETGSRPRAEGDHGNKAGLDLTPGAWAALGVHADPDDILQRVDWWEFQ